MTYVALYFMSVVDGLKALFFGMGLLGLVISFIYTIVGNDGLPRDENEEKEADKILKRRDKVFTWSLIVFFIWAFTPTKKDLILIIGGGAIINYLNNSEEAKQLPENVFKFLNKQLSTDYNDSSQPNNSGQQ